MWGLILERVGCSWEHTVPKPLPWGSGMPGRGTVAGHPGWINWAWYADWIEPRHCQVKKEAEMAFTINGWAPRVIVKRGGGFWVANMW